MSRRNELLKHLRALGEIDHIMGSMRTLSMLETRKVQRFIACQEQVVQFQRAAAADLLAFYPELARFAGGRRAAYLLIGSERGFCGDFNTSLRAELEQRLKSDADAAPLVIGVGRKLALELEHTTGSFRSLDGPGVADEVPRVLLGLVETLNGLIEEHGPLRLTALYHGGDDGGIRETRVIPSFGDIPPPERRFSHPPYLYETPETVFAHLVEHYLFANLHAIFYFSLLHEHQRRIQHLDGATRRLEQKMETLKVRSNLLRQEDITEELEVILLGSAALADGSELEDSP